MLGTPASAARYSCAWEGGRPMRLGELFPQGRPTVPTPLSSAKAEPSAVKPPQACPQPSQPVPFISQRPPAQRRLSSHRLSTPISTIDTSAVQRRSTTTTAAYRDCHLYCVPSLPLLPSHSFLAPSSPIPAPAA